MWPGKKVCSIVDEKILRIFIISSRKRYTLSKYLHFVLCKCKLWVAFYFNMVPTHVLRINQGKIKYDVNCTRAIIFIKDKTENKSFGLPSCDTLVIYSVQLVVLFKNVSQSPDAQTITLNFFFRQKNATTF